MLQGAANGWARNAAIVIDKSRSVAAYHVLKHRPQRIVSLTWFQ